MKYPFTDLYTGGGIGMNLGKGGGGGSLGVWCDFDLMGLTTKPTSKTALIAYIRIRVYFINKQWTLYMDNIERSLFDKFIGEWGLTPFLPPCP